MKSKKLITITLAGVMALALSACGSTAGTASGTASVTASVGTTALTKLTGSITGSGSSALFPLAQDAAESFKEEAPNVSVTMNAGGSGTGLKQVYDGSVDIGNSDVEASKKLDATQASELVDHKVCVISMAPIVNKDVKEAGVSSLTSDQLVSIFTGKTLNWKDVGGPDEDIVLITRPSTSGTRALFQEYALSGQEEASNTALETDDSGTLLQSVADTKGAIGYIALSYLVNDDTVSAMSIDGVEPTLENTYSGKWKVWGYEHMYTKGEPKEAAKAYLEYIMSDTYGQKMESLGYCVTSKMQVTR